MVYTLEDCIKDFGEIPLCSCGCGNKVNVNPKFYYNYKSKGYPKYIDGHNRIGTHHSKESKLLMSESQIIVQNCPEVKLRNSQSHKGQIPWMKGKHHSPETIEKLRQARLNQECPTKGKHWKMPEDWTKWNKERMSGSNNPMYGVSLSGSNHWNWQGGISYAPYCPKFNNAKKEEIRNKYNRCCILCGKHESQNVTRNGKQIKLDVHHIDYNKDQGCKDHKWMLAPLCISCHRKTNNKRELWEPKICEILINIDKNAN